MSEFVYKIPKDASYVTLRNQNRMIYANYRIQQNNVQQGCQIRVALENGGVADADIIPKLLEGARETTAAEVQIDISSGACPVANIPDVAVDPYLTDKIYASLTTSAASYKAATTGSWVAITSTEYTALQTNVTNTTVAGVDTTTLDNIGGSGFIASDFIVTHASGSVAIPTNSYFFAVVVKIKNPTTTILNGFRAYTNNSTSSYDGFVQRGNILPVLTAGMNYLVLKGASVKSTGNGLIAVSAPGDGTADAQSWHMVLGATAAYSLRFETTLPITESTTLSNSFANRAFGIQGLASTSIQWVT